MQEQIQKYIEIIYMPYIYKNINPYNYKYNDNDFEEKYIQIAINSDEFNFYDNYCKYYDKNIDAYTLCDLINYINDYYINNFGNKYEWNYENSVDKIINLFAYTYVYNIGIEEWKNKSLFY